MQNSEKRTEKGTSEASETIDEKRSPDVVFENLSNSRRREIIRCLWEREGSVPISTVVEEVAAAENDTDVASLTYEQRKRVYTTLHQSHLPKLVEDGFIKRDDDEIELTPAAAQLKAHMELHASNKNANGWGPEPLNKIRSWLSF